NFKATFSSTLNDLEGAIVDESQSWHGGWTHDVIEQRGGGGAAKLDLKSLRLDVIEGSKEVAAALKAKLNANYTLQAAKKTAKVTDAEWTTLVEQFTGVLVKHASKRALNRLADSRRNAFGGWRILTVAESEAYPGGEGGSDYL